MPARLLALPFVLLTSLFLYLTFEVAESFSTYIIPNILILAIIYTLSPQINWWWYKRFPPDIAKPLRQLFIKQYPFYNKLSVEDKQKFRNRVALGLETIEFIPKGWEAIPEDVMGIIVANLVRMTFGQQEFLLSKFERIVIYTLPFPSPQYPDKLHASELYEEDGVLLFSAQQVMWVFAKPKQYYNLVLHEFVKAFQIQYPTKNYPILREEDWSLLEKISGLKKTQIEGVINLPNIDPSIVSGVLYFTHPERLYSLQPSLFEQWKACFVGI